MAPVSKKKGPARWVVVLGTGLASVGFFFAVVANPLPSQATVPAQATSALTEQTPTSTSVPPTFSQQTTTSQRSSTISSTTANPSASIVPIGRSRLRTRGS